MPSIDMKNNIKVVNAIDIQSISTDTTTAGDIIDLRGFESCTIALQTGTITDGDYTLLLEEGDDSGLSDAANVADADLIGTEAGASFSADTDDNLVGTVGYTGNKRYLRASVVSTNTSSGGTVGAVGILGHPDVAPTTQ